MLSSTTYTRAAADRSVAFSCVFDLTRHLPALRGHPCPPLLLRWLWPRLAGTTSRSRGSARRSRPHAPPVPTLPPQARYARLAGRRSRRASSVPQNSSHVVRGPFQDVPHVYQCSLQAFVRLQQLRVVSRIRFA